MNLYCCSVQGPVSICGFAGLVIINKPPKKHKYVNILKITAVTEKNNDPKTPWQMKCRQASCL